MIKIPDEEKKDAHSDWSKIIKAVTTPLAFFTFFMLVIESVALTLGVLDKIDDWIFFTLSLVVLISVVTIMIFKPELFREGKVKKDFSVKMMLNLNSSVSGAVIPRNSNDFNVTDCHYSLNDGNKKIIKNKEAIIYTDIELTTPLGRQIYPYIFIPVPIKLKDPSIKLKVIFKGHEWNLFNDRINQRTVDLT